MMNKILPIDQITKENCAYQRSMIIKMSNLSACWGKVTWIGTNVGVVLSVASYTFKYDYIYPVAFTSLVAISSLFFDFMKTNSEEHLSNLDQKFPPNQNSSLEIQDLERQFKVEIVRFTGYGEPLQVDPKELFKAIREVHGFPARN